MKKKLITIVIFHLFICNLFSQQTNSTSVLSISFGSSFNGSGDMRGLIFGTEFTHHYKKKWSWGAALSGTIHDQNVPIFYSLDGRDYNASIRSTTAGVQVSPYVGYNFLRTNKHEFKVLGGPLLRYQTSSDAGFSIYYPIVSNLPFPVVSFEQNEPMRTFSVGAHVGLRYQYNIKPNIGLGIQTSLQTDTNGDLLRNTQFSIGYRL